MLQVELLVKEFTPYIEDSQNKDPPLPSVVIIEQPHSQVLFKGRKFRGKFVIKLLHSTSRSHFKVTSQVAAFLAHEVTAPNGEKKVEVVGQPVECQPLEVDLTATFQNMKLDPPARKEKDKMIKAYVLFVINITVRLFVPPRLHSPTPCWFMH